MEKYHFYNVLLPLNEVIEFAATTTRIYYIFIHKTIKSILGLYESCNPTTWRSRLDDGISFVGF